jgi:predicted DNA-binding transcriptional regulator AlpA
MKDDEAPSRRSREARPGSVLVTAQQASTFTGLPYKSILDLHHRGLLPVVRFTGGRRVWFRRRDIELLIESSLQAS